MKRIVAGAAIAILLVGIGSFWFGRLHAFQSVHIERVSVSQLADAMQQDHYYSDYGGTALLFKAQVAAHNYQDGMTVVTFVTNRPYTVSCQFAGAIAAKSGQTLSVAAPGGSAERKKSGILLRNCVEN